MSPSRNSPSDPAALALGALGWLLSDDQRAGRLLDLTGLDADMLRNGLDKPAILAAILAFLENHEPDLIGAADALGVSPADLVSARRELTR